MTEDLAREREIQADIVKFFRTLGCVVIVLSQYRASRVSVGLPDLKVFVPRKRAHFWWETKGPRGAQRQAQRTFQQVAEACGESYWMGGMEQAIETARELGLLAHPVPVPARRHDGGIPGVW